MVCCNRASCWIDWMEFDDESQPRLGIPQPYDCGYILSKLNCILIHTLSGVLLLARALSYNKAPRRRPAADKASIANYRRQWIIPLGNSRPILAASTFRTTYSSAFLILSLFFQRFFLQRIASPRLFNSDGGLYRYALRGGHQAFSTPFGLKLHRSFKGSDTSEYAC